MKKIGILTLYFDNANYGGLLQAYSLQYILKKFEYEPKQISYNFLSGYGRCFYLKSYVKKVLRKFDPWYRNCYSIFSSTVKKFEITIPHTKYVNNITISKLNHDFDMFICGSDQIWNPVGWQPNFFLAFANKPKISYAASVARNELSNEELKYLDLYTKDFSSLSVREKNISEYLTNTLKRDFKLVPDPTLLLTTEEWNKRFPNLNVYKRPYVFAYFLGFNEKQRNDCIDFAKKRGLDIYFIPYMNKESYEWEKKYIKNCVNDYSVESFVNLIRNAELVLTDSFHGAVFSCIFETPFYVFNRELIGKQKSMNSRLDTLFYELKISDNRMINGLKEVENYNFSEQEILNIRNGRNQWRNIGIEYIKVSLNKVQNDPIN